MPVKEIATFSVSYMQILDENGKVDKELEPKLPKEDLIRLHRAMTLARRFDERMLKMQRQGRIGTFAPCTGMEASHCPVALAMQPQDWFVDAFREMGARLMLGETPAQVLDYYNGFEEGSRQPKGYKRILPINIIVGSQHPQAAGIAYAMKYLGEKDTAVVCFLGDGATSEGDFHEGLNFAAVWKVPVVFVCQNNQWAISVPRRMQTTSRTLAQKAVAYDMPCIQVDGNDPLVVYAAAKEALDRARKGEGPTLIEAVTYRLLMHTTADDPKKYRTEEEEKAAWKLDPLPRFQKYLNAKKIWSDKQQEQMEAEIQAEIDAAVKEFETPKEYAIDDPFNFVFGTQHRIIEEQRAELLESVRLESSDGKA